MGFHKQLFRVCSLLIGGGLAFACSQPAPKASRTDTILTAPESPAPVVEAELEAGVMDAVAAEPAPAPLPNQTDSFTAGEKLDLVVAVDETIGDERGIAALSSELNFLGRALSLGMDTQIHFMTGVPLTLPDLDAKKIGFIDQGVGPTDIISLLGMLFANEFAEQYVDAAGDALAAPLALRNDAKLEVIIMSSGNGEDDGNLAADFDPNNALKAKVSAVVPQPDSVESDVCTIDAVGLEYINLSKKLGGTTLDVCGVDFSKIFATLAADISKRNLNFKLSQKPLDPKSLTVSVNGKALPPGNWAYDANTNAITILTIGVLAIGSKVDIKYDVPAKMP